MNVLVVSAHDQPRSLTSALHNTTLGVMQRIGAGIAVSELHAEGFSPMASKLDFKQSSGVNANYMFEQQRAVNTGSGFSPDITSEMSKVQHADLLIFHFPLWWSAPPTILKGWLERVLAMGFAWDGGNRYDKGLLRGKRALVVVSAGDPEAYYQVDGMHGATVEQHLYPLLHSTLAFCGMDVLKPFVIYNTTAGDHKDVEVQIEALRKHLSTIETCDDYIYRHP